MAQDKKSIDSLLQVKNYLLEIKTTVNVEKWNGEVQKNKIRHLIEKGIVYDKNFSVWFKKMLPREMKSCSSLHRDFKLIIQTLALYHSDIKTNPEIRPANQSDLKFLNHSIPRLVDEIYRYCKLAEEERLKKIHSVQ